MSEIVEAEVSSQLNIGLRDPIYFEKKIDDGLLVFEIVNFVLERYGFENFSIGQFKRIAGGSANSSNKIRNYATGYGIIANGFTYLGDIVSYCQLALDNSLLIPLEDVIGEFKWAKKAINENY